MHSFLLECKVISLWESTFISIGEIIISKTVCTLDWRVWYERRFMGVLDKHVLNGIQLKLRIYDMRLMINGSMAMSVGVILLFTQSGSWDLWK